jgi:hypothetical protein
MMHSSGTHLQECNSKEKGGNETMNGLEPATKDDVCIIYIAQMHASEIKEYQLPVSMVEQFTKVTQDPRQPDLREFCMMFAAWFYHRNPDQLLIEAIAHFENDVSIRYGYEFDGDAKRIEILAVQKMTTREDICDFWARESALSRLLTNPDLFDALGDQAFGEHRWQNVRTWMDEK